METARRIRPIFSPSLELILEGAGEYIGAELAILDAVAEEYGLKRLSDFNADNWFSVRTGIMACDSLANLIEASPDVAKRFGASKKVAEDLYDVVRALSAAAARKAAFRLEIVDVSDGQAEAA